MLNAKIFKTLDVNALRLGNLNSVLWHSHWLIFKKKKKYASLKLTLFIGQNLVTKLVVPTTLLNKINITTYFENSTVKLHVLYTLNTHVKFCVNHIFYTI